MFLGINFVWICLPASNNLWVTCLFVFQSFMSILELTLNCPVDILIIIL